MTYFCLTAFPLQFRFRQRFRFQDSLVAVWEQSNSKQAFANKPKNLSNFAPRGIEMKALFAFLQHPKTSVQHFGQLTISLKNYFSKKELLPKEMEINISFLFEATFYAVLHTKSSYNCLYNINVTVNLGISQIWQLDKARAFAAKYYLTGDRLSKLIKHLSIVE